MIVHIGTAGWSYKDWEGIVYPRGTKRPLQYLSRFINTVEINSSFYRPPAADTAKRWLDFTADRTDFTFTYKLWNRFSHERAGSSLNADEKIVKPGMDVLSAKEKLGATLIQFPWSFKKTDENMAWVTKLLNRFADYHPFLEMRHASWDCADFLELLSNRNAGFVNIDQPLIGQSIGLTTHRTTDRAYLRLHGRNYKNWFADNADGAARYNYHYPTSELTDILDTIVPMIEKSAKTFIIYNNHYRGQAVANALQTMFLLTEKKLPVPEKLPDLYPELKGIAAPEQGGQMTIF